jgi:hypothetical protein
MKGLHSSPKSSVSAIWPVLPMPQDSVQKLAVGGRLVRGPPRWRITRVRPAGPCDLALARGRALLAALLRVGQERVVRVQGLDAALSTPPSVQMRVHAVYSSTTGVAVRVDQLRS